MNTVYFAQRTGLFTENKVFETGLALRGQVLSKLGNERSLDHLGRQMGGGAHTLVRCRGGGVSYTGQVTDPGEGSVIGVGTKGCCSRKGKHRWDHRGCC